MVLAFSRRFSGSVSASACVVSMNIFINFVKKSSAGGGTRGGVGALEGVEASLLPGSDLSGASASSICSPEMSAGGLTKGLRRVVRNPGAIVKNRSLNVILPNGLADLFGMELLEL